MKGAELETEIRLGGGFSFDGSISYLDFEYTDINPATGVTLDMIDPVYARAEMERRSAVRV